MWDPTRLLRIDEAAVFAGRNASTIRAWINRRKLAAVRQGKRTLIRLGDLLDRMTEVAAELAKQDVNGKLTARACAQVR